MNTKHVVFVFLVALLAGGCKSTPTSPGTTPTQGLAIDTAALSSFTTIEVKLTGTAEWNYVDPGHKEHSRHLSGVIVDVWTASFVRWNGSQATADTSFSGGHGWLRGPPRDGGNYGEYTGQFDVDVQSGNAISGKVLSYRSEWQTDPMGNVTRDEKSTGGLSFGPIPAVKVTKDTIVFSLLGQALVPLLSGIVSMNVQGEVTSGWSGGWEIGTTSFVSGDWDQVPFPNLTITFSR
jgi:hypothetical protein